MTILDKIVEQKKTELASLKLELSDLKPVNLNRLSFRNSLTKDSIQIIAEIKKASPSKGILVEDFDHLKLAHEYQSGGAAALSVLTDEKFFMGHLDYLKEVSELNLLPTLRKDFIIDNRQIEQAYFAGASAILLIVAILSVEQLISLHRFAEMLKIDVLVEVHNQEELVHALKLENPIIGINNRNLHTFETSLDVALTLGKQIPKEIVKVTESGIFTRHDMTIMEDAGFQAALIGESIVKSQSRTAKLKELLGK